MEKVVEFISMKEQNLLRFVSCWTNPVEGKLILLRLCRFTIPDVFIVGYGLNYGDYYRKYLIYLLLMNKKQDKIR